MRDLRQASARLRQAEAAGDERRAREARREVEEAGARRDAMESRHSVALNDQLADEVLSEVEARHGQQG